MYDMDNELIIANTSSNKEIDNIDKSISKLEEQSKRLIDLYLESNLNVDIINKKNEKLKKDIDTLRKKKESLDPNNQSKEYLVELQNKLDCYVKNDEILFPNKLEFAFMWNSLNKKSQRQLLNYLISSIEITRNKNYNIEIKNITFTEQFINKNPKEYIEYLYFILRNNNIGFIYKEQIDESKLTEYEKDYLIISLSKLQNNLYSKEETTNYLTQIKSHFFVDGIIERPLTKNNKFIDNILFISKKSI